MKRLTLLLFSFLLLTAQSSFAQVIKPVKWSWTSEKISETEYKLVFKADIEETWAVYSQFIDEGGPIPTTFTFDEGGHFTLIGQAEESGNLKKSFDKVFEMDIAKFYDEGIFTQKIKVNDPSTPITGYLTYMTCDDTRCLPPTDEDFSFDLTKISSPAGEQTDPGASGSTGGEEPDDQLEIGMGGTLGTAGPAGDVAAAGTGNQLEKPVSWTFAVEKINDSEYELIYTAKLKKYWSIYSMFTDDDGPIPTSIHFDNSEGIETIGEAVESGYKKEGPDPMFDGVNVIKFTDNEDYVIRQRIKVLDATKPLNGYLDYMSCDDTKCINLQEDFGFDLVKGVAVAYTPQLDNDQTAAASLGDGADGNPVTKHSFDKELEESSCDKNDKPEKKQSSWWLIFLLGFGGGLIAILTPCVFPMIPLTVSYFTKSSTTRAKGIRNAIYYGLSIIVIYLILGLLITGIFGADALNLLSTNAWFNIGFAVLFIIFAISFFGYFEITLPSSWANKSDKMAERSGLIGIFFMAFTLTLVSFSCTGPIIGTLLVETATGGGATILGSIPVGPLFGMLGFSVALALPFALFAMFPSWLNSMPKSGSWMNTVKVTLGFIEIALALKFLSIADLTMNWKFMPYELFVGLWVLIAIAMALYYFGKLRFKMDPPVKKLSTGRIVGGSLMLLVAAYFASGFMVNEKSNTFVTPNLLSGLAPPAGHSYLLPKHCPLNIDCYHDYDEGLAYAQEHNKPILLDFTGYGCVNCRRMEDNVWSKKEINDIITGEYVLISLYVDDRKPLEEQYISSFSGKKMRTVGNKWADFQAIHFGRNSQPFYVLTAPDGKVLNKPVAYTPDVDEYRSFLECGLERFEELQSATNQLTAK
jgi:thiol:disulfide interchange protein DsbD